MPYYNIYLFTRVSTCTYFSTYLSSTYFSIYLPLTHLSTPYLTHLPDHQTYPWISLKCSLIIKDVAFLLSIVWSFHIPSIPYINYRGQHYLLAISSSFAMIRLWTLDTERYRLLRTHSSTASGTFHLIQSFPPNSSIVCQQSINIGRDPQ